MEKALINKSDTLKALAIEYLALQPNISNKQVSEKLGVPVRTLTYWRSNPDFGEAVYKRAMIEFGLELPAVLKATLREAKAGNVQAQRLVLEHSGKLVKNNINVIVSPWEMFMQGFENKKKKVTNADFQEIPNIKSSDIEIINANSKGRIKEEKVKNFQEIQKEVSKHKRNIKQKEWYLWRKRAKEAGIESLKSKRPTPAQRKEWEESIIIAEKLRNTK